MSGVRTLDVAPEEAGLRLDRWFRRRFPEVPHGRLAKLLRTGQVRIDGKRAKPGDRLEAGQSVRVPPLGDAAPPPRPRVKPAAISEADAETLRARVLHRDKSVLVIDKPAGLAVQGGSGTTRHLDAMLDALRFEAKERPRLVHRLDKDTSGVLVLARSAAVAAKLTAAFRAKTVRKVYWAVVAGIPKLAAGRIELALAKKPGRQGERVVADPEDGQRAVTFYRIAGKAGKRAAWVVFEPRTGRTHQLRVHAAFLGTPILGDGKYGGQDAFLPGGVVGRRLHLHARALRLPHPDGGEVRVIAPLPEHMRETWRLLGFDENVEDDPFIDF